MICSRMLSTTQLLYGMNELELELERISLTHTSFYFFLSILTNYSVLVTSDINEMTSRLILSHSPLFRKQNRISFH
jgi:hypothetical protein